MPNPTASIFGCAFLSLLGLIVFLPAHTTTPGMHPLARIHRNSAQGPVGYSPQQMRHAYGFDRISNTGKGSVISIVSAYDAPQIAHDLTVFNQTFSLLSLHGLIPSDPCTIAKGPHPCFEKMSPSPIVGHQKDWALETSLDTEWSHAIAPESDILLMEAKDSSISSLFSAVDLAVKKKAHIVSLSWGGSEWNHEVDYEKHFQHTGVLFVAASGDFGTGPIYPASSARVLAVGGTHLSLDAIGNRVGEETAWSGSGGGISNYIKRPAYQKQFNTSAYRVLPDVSYNADPTTGVAVYDSDGVQNQKGWFEIGGTSAGAPQWAGLLALASQKHTTPIHITTTRSPIYSVAGKNYTLNFHDISHGSNGNCGVHCQAATGFDLVTGLGTPNGDHLVNALNKEK